MLWKLYLEPRWKGLSRRRNYLIFFAVLTLYGNGMIYSILDVYTSAPKNSSILSCLEQQLWPACVLRSTLVFDMVSDSTSHQLALRQYLYLAWDFVGIFIVPYFWYRLIVTDPGVLPRCTVSSQVLQVDL